MAARPLPRRLCVAVVMVFVLVTTGATAANGGIPRSGAVHATTSSAPCQAMSNATIHSVVWIWMENESIGAIIGSASAPYQTALARRCGLAANYSAISHPSLPNYLAATGGSTFGVAADGEPSVYPIHSASLFSEVSAAHESWRAYDESMPTDCDLVTSGEYAARHNPAVYYVPLRAQCAHDDVPLGSLANGAFATAARQGTLPNFSFVTPNICDDAHSCPINQGDRWLSQFVPIILNSPQFNAGSLALFPTYDEGEGTNTVATTVIAREVRPGTVVHRAFTHYSLLRTTEQLLGLPLLGAAARAASMSAAFGL